MSRYHNISKSAFRPKQYVGWIGSTGHSGRIVNFGSGRKDWWNWFGPVGGKGGMSPSFRTLGELSSWLASN